MTNWSNFAVGLFFGLVFSWIESFWKRLCVGAVLSLLLYRILINATAHAGLDGTIG